MAKGGAGRGVRHVAWAAAVTAVVVGLGVAVAPGVVETPEPEPEVLPADVPLAQVTLNHLDPKRAPFCEHLSDEVVEAAVGGPALTTEYRSGDEATLDRPGSTDVVSEFGCTFTNGTTEAQVWVFAAPVSDADAEAMVQENAAEPGCAAAGRLRYGVPGQVLECRTDDERVIRAVGRIGDSWVHCELTTPPADRQPTLLERGQRFCAQAVYAMQ